MRAFWRGPWMRSKLSLSDDQQVELLSKRCDIDQLSAKENSPQAPAPQEHFVGFGIGGAGNIRKVKTRRADKVKANSDSNDC
ncbi:hypothetical protein BJX99DRAFT_230533 [Aspergillus californicus]